MTIADTEHIIFDKHDVVTVYDKIITEFGLESVFESVYGESVEEHGLNPSEESEIIHSVLEEAESTYDIIEIVVGDNHIYAVAELE